MNQKSIMYIGFDDTDSPKGMCTTFLAYKIVSLLRKQNVEFLDYPRLIRLNPNIPWKTRGNGAVAFKIKTSNPTKVKEEVKQLVHDFSDTKNGANPGLIFYENENIVDDFKKFSELALWKLVKRNYAKKFINKDNLESFYMGNGQGLIGAISAIGYEFSDHTFELLSYRKKTHFGKERKLDKKSVITMQQKLKDIFNSFDSHENRVLITPHGPDPVFYGLRGENPKCVIDASQMIQTSEKLDGYLVFKTNQGTADHLKNKINVLELQPYTSGVVEGLVITKPRIETGGHVFFSLYVDGCSINCAVYKPTKITKIAQDLIAGDKIRVGGGIRKSTKKHPRILNVEFIEILKLEKNFKHVNPMCKNCNKKMKSKGKNQGFQCVKCSRKSHKKSIQIIPRKIKSILYLPSSSAHRHLTRPKQRIGKINLDTIFDKRIPWFGVFKN